MQTLNDIAEEINGSVTFEDNAIFYREGLVSIDGVLITLFRQMKYHTYNDIVKAKNKLRNERDVVKFQIVNLI